MRTSVSSLVRQYGKVNTPTAFFQRFAQLCRIRVISHLVLKVQDIKSFRRDRSISVKDDWELTKQDSFTREERASDEWRYYWSGSDHPQYEMPAHSGE